MSFSEHELETDAIDKCSRSLDRLNMAAKVRVLRYLIERFGLTPPPIPKPDGVTNHINIQNNLMLPAPHEVPKELPQSNITIISPSDAWLKGYATTEPELLLLLVYHVVHRGNSTFTKPMLMEEYREAGMSTPSRSSNFNYNFNALIKKDWIKSLNTENFSLRDAGKSDAEAIMSGTRVEEQPKPRKPRARKPAGLKREVPEAVESAKAEIADGQA